MSSELDELGDSSLRELYDQEKRLTNLMQIELTKFREEAALFERTMEMNEEFNSNSLQNRLIKYKSNNKVLSSQVKHHKSLTRHLKENYKSLQEQISEIKNETKFCSKLASEAIEKDAQINKFIQDVQESMDSGELNEEVINEKLLQINEELTDADNKLDNSILTVSNTAQALNKDNLVLTMAIQHIEDDAGAFRRRRTSTGHVATLLASPERIRRHTDSKSPLRRNRLGSK